MTIARKLSSYLTIAPARRLAIAVTVLFVLVTPPSVCAQTFLAEWAQADIGRVGPTGMALDTISGTTYLYVADQPAGRIIKIDATTGQRVSSYRALARSVAPSKRVLNGNASLVARVASLKASR